MMGTGGKSKLGEGWGGGDARLAGRAVGTGGKPRFGAGCGGGVSRLPATAESDLRIETTGVGWGERTG